MPTRSAASATKTASCSATCDNPNGSLDDIAGIASERGNVVGLMPHPERASDALLGSDDGVVLLRSLLAAAAGTRHAQRVMPAFFSVSADTPSCRHAA